MLFKKGDDVIDPSLKESLNYFSKNLRHKENPMLNLPSKASIAAIPVESEKTYVNMPAL